MDFSIVWVFAKEIKALRNWLVCVTRSTPIKFQKPIGRSLKTGGIVAMLVQIENNKSSLHAAKVNCDHEKLVEKRIRRIDF